MTNLATNLRDATAQFPDRPAVRMRDQVLTYSDLDELTARVAGWLRERGVEPGDRVGVMVPNVVAFPVLYYGVLRVGGIVVPMNPLLKAREVEHCLGDSGARLVCAWETAAEEAAAGAESVGADCHIITDALMNRLLPHSSLHIYPDGHLGLVTHAHELAPRVADFLR